MNKGTCTEEAKCVLNKMKGKKKTMSHMASEYINLTALNNNNEVHVYLHAKYFLLL